MHRFYIPNPDFSGSELHIGDTIAYQISRVLRLDSDDLITIFDGDGTEWILRITAVKKHEVVTSIHQKRSVEKDTPLKLVLGQGLPKGQKMDLIIQKGTELGAAKFVPVAMNRSIVKINENEFNKKVSRWEKIAIEATEQCGRSIVPIISNPHSLSKFCESEKSADIKIVLWENESKQNLKVALKKIHTPKRIALLVGPEGGISDDEVKVASDFGFISIGLGKYKLKTETAGLAAIAMILFNYGGFEAEDEEN